MDLLLDIDIGGVITRNVTLTLNVGVPIVSLPQTFGAKREGELQTRDYAVSEEVYDRAKLNAITIPQLSVVGDTTTNRFVFITVVASYVKKVEAYIYYDTVNKMMFMMPDPNMMEDALNVNGTVIGLRIGQALFGDVNAGTFTLPSPSVTGEPVTTVSIVSRGLEYGGADSYRTKLNDLYTVASDRANIIEYAVISDALTFAEDINYVSFNMIDIATRKISTLKFGAPTEMLIPLTF